jgi:hypothetical protein
MNYDYRIALGMGVDAETAGLIKLARLKREQERLERLASARTAMVRTEVRNTVSAVLTQSTVPSATQERGTAAVAVSITKSTTKKRAAAPAAADGKTVKTAHETGSVVTTSRQTKAVRKAADQIADAAPMEWKTTKVTTKVQIGGQLHFGFGSVGASISHEVTKELK